jgi:hypothetical protein
VVRVVLDGNAQNPTTVIDTRWNLIDANAAAFWLTDGVADRLLAWPINVARLSLHPEGLAPRIEGFAEFGDHLVRRMRQTLASTHDAELAELVDECERFVPPTDRNASVGDDVVLPMRLRVGDEHLTFMSTITTFGAARDVTLSELSIETLYPADDDTRRFVETQPWLAGPTS